MNKAVFLDRDGTINSDEGHYYVFRPEDFMLNEGVYEAIKLFKENGYLVVVVTNQGGVAKKEYTVSDVIKTNTQMQTLLDGMLDETYFCPHHDKIEKCLCRKPDSLLIEKAVSRFNIDKEKSVFIGDSQRDVEAAKKSGIKYFKISKNCNLLLTLRQSEFSFLID